MNKETSDLIIFLTGSIGSITAGYYGIRHGMNNYGDPLCLAAIDYGVRKSPAIQKLYPDIQSNCEGLGFGDTLSFYLKNFKLDL